MIEVASSHQAAPAHSGVRPAPTQTPSACNGAQPAAEEQQRQDTASFDGSSTPLLTKAKASRKAAASRQTSLRELPGPKRRPAAAPNSTAHLPSLCRWRPPRRLSWGRRCWRTGCCKAVLTLLATKLGSGWQVRGCMTATSARAVSSHTPVPAGITISSTCCLKKCRYRLTQSVRVWCAYLVDALQMTPSSPSWTLFAAAGLLC